MSFTIKFLFLLLCLPILPSCIHQINRNNLLKVSIGMSKEQAIACLGKPYLNRGAHIQDDGALWEVIEYQVQIWADTRTIFLYFHDDKLVQYCQLGDFSKAA